MTFFHDGGWVICSLDTHDALCLALTLDSGTAVLSVDYRLAPKTPTPGPLYDCHDAMVWPYEHAEDSGIDRERLAVAGDSASGNLAASVAIGARDAGSPAPPHQLLYPITDMVFNTPAYHVYGGNMLLSRSLMRYYTGDSTEPHPRAAPLRHPDLSQLPPATLNFRIRPPLRDEGLAYAEPLHKAGVTVYSEEASGIFHGFMSMPCLIPDTRLVIARFRPPAQRPALKL